MTKIIAHISIIIATGFLTLGNYWFTFGLWPKSWLSFFLFIIGTIILHIVWRQIEKEN